jgi:hypothetical protein
VQNTPPDVPEPRTPVLQFRCATVKQLSKRLITKRLHEPFRDENPERHRAGKKRSAAGLQILAALRLSSERETGLEPATLSLGS